LLSLIYLSLATRTLGLAGFGQFALIVVFAQGLAGLASFNTWQAVVRWGNREGDSAQVAGFAVALDLASIVGGLALAGVACWSAPVWLPVSADLRVPAFGLCAAALIALRSTPTGLLRLHDRYDMATLAEAALPAVRAVGAIAAAFAMPSIEGFLAAWALAELSCSLAYWLLAKRYVRLRLSDLSLTGLPRAHEGVWRFVLATNFSRTLAVTAKQILLLGVGALGGAALAGGYRVASQLGQALVQLGEAVSRAIYPEFVRRESSSAMLARMMGSLAAGTGVIAVLLAWLFGEWAIALIAGSDFTFAYHALVLLALAGALDLAGVCREAWLVAEGRAGTAFLLRAVPLLAALSVMPLVIARWGIEGAASCLLLVSMATLAGLCAVAMRRPSEDRVADTSL